MEEGRVTRINTHKLEAQSFWYLTAALIFHAGFGTDLWLCANVANSLSLSVSDWYIFTP